MPLTPGLANRLLNYVKGAAKSAPEGDAYVEECIAQAVVLVDSDCGTSVDLVPTEVLERAYIEAGAELFYRKSSPQGISQYAAVDGAAIRTRRDPLEAVRPLYMNFLPGGFA